MSWVLRDLAAGRSTGMNPPPTPVPPEPAGLKTRPARLYSHRNAKERVYVPPHTHYPTLHAQYAIPDTPYPPFRGRQ